MATNSNLYLDGFATGESTLVDGSAQVTASDGEVIDSATADATIAAIAIDDEWAVAMTELSGSVNVAGEDGSGAAVSTETTAFASGDYAVSYSTTDSLAISTPGADVALGRTYSYAYGDESYADASVEAYGDITGGGDADIDGDYFSAALAVGLAVDVAAF